jgi:uncharacterized protein
VQGNEQSGSEEGQATGPGSGDTTSAPEHRAENPRAAGADANGPQASTGTAGVEPGTETAATVPAAADGSAGSGADQREHSTTTEGDAYPPTEPGAGTPLTAPVPERAAVAASGTNGAASTTGSAQPVADAPDPVPPAGPYPPSGPYPPGSYPPEWAYPPGSYSPAGAYPSGAYPPGAYQPGWAYLPGAYPSAGPYPPGPYPPAGQYPTGSFPAAAGPYPSGPYPPVGPYPTGPYPTYPTYPPVHPAAHAPAPPRNGHQTWGAPPPTRTHRWGLGAYLLAEAVFLVSSAVISFLVIGQAEPTATRLAVALAGPTILAAGTALLITWVRGNGPRIDLCLGWSWRDVGLGLAFGIGGLALTIPASILYVAIVGQDASSAVGDVFGGIRAGPVMAAVVLVIVVLIAPLCEEILYRGLLWGGLERLAGRWVAFVVSTLLFALAHFEFTRTPLLLVVAIPIALARLLTGRLLPSIIAHQINNLLPGIVLALGLMGVVPMA